MIRLYYIENISETDIPYFEDIYAMNGFFTSHLVDTISGEGSYYPPYYTNRIKLSIAGDINYEGTSVNYLALDYGSKRYFYFIDSIDYVNEDCYEINIHMDTIMTFYFDIEISAAMVERAFINRWGATYGNHLINRDYIRENFSNGNYKIDSNSITDGLNRNRWVVIALMNRFNDFPPGSNIYQNLAKKWSIPLIQNLVKTDGTETQTLPQTSKKPGWMLWSFYNCSKDTYVNAQTSVEEPYPRPVGQSAYYYDAYTYTQEANTGDPLMPATESVPAGVMDNVVNHLADDPYIKDLFVIPFIPFKDVSITLVGTSYKIAFNAMYMNIGGEDDSDDNKCLFYGFPKGIIAPIYQDGSNRKIKSAHQSPLAPIRSVVNNSSNICPTFIANHAIGVTFDKDYCPQLIDSNYIQITFGTIYANTTYPIEYLETDKLYGKYYADCFTGKRYYYLTKSDTEYYDTYNTIVCDDNILTLEMDNDPWKEYAANNKSRWATIGVQAGINAIKDCISVAGLVGGVDYVNDMANLKKYVINRDMDKRKKKAKDIGKARIAMTELDRQEDLRTTSNRAISSGVGILDSVVAITNQLQTEYNYQHSPQSMIRGGDTSSVVTGQAWAIRSVVRICENIDQVAQIYHRIGYNVKKYEPNTLKLTALFNNYKLRYYYNIVQLGECSVHIVKRMENEDIVLDIKRRLQEGIRYWNISVTDFELCNFKYDNVELAYL